MAGRIADEEQDAIFRPYPNTSEAQRSQTTKEGGKNVTKLEPPIVEDKATSSASAQATSTKKKKKKKRPKKKSSVGYQLLLSWTSWHWRGSDEVHYILMMILGNPKPFHRIVWSTLSVFNLYSPAIFSVSKSPRIRWMIVHKVFYWKFGKPLHGGISDCSYSTKAEWLPKFTDTAEGELSVSWGTVVWNVLQMD